MNLMGGISHEGQKYSVQSHWDGNTSLKLYNRTIREVTQVRRVPDLKRNLIFLGMLDQNEI